jgi:hypothetical protein
MEVRQTAWQLFGAVRWQVICAAKHRWTGALPGSIEYDAEGAAVVRYGIGSDRLGQEELTPLL